MPEDGFFICERNHAAPYIMFAATLNDGARLICPRCAARFIARMTDIGIPGITATRRRNVAAGQPLSNFAIWLAPHRLDDRLEIEFRRRQRSLSQRELASLVGREWRSRGHDPIIVGGGQQAAGRAARLIIQATTIL